MPESATGQRKRATMTQAISAQCAALTEIDWRLLQWLLRYPLQRADDLMVGVARWASRATVYRHLQGLEVSGLVESVVAATPGTGKRLYHLSNFGLHVLARHLEKPAGELAAEWQADEKGFMRLLPRLPVLLVLQDVVNGLITGAAEAMSNQGRRPQLVRWTWQRDVVHRFQYREHAVRMFVDGAMALCIRTLQGDGSPADWWYGLFLLCTELDDVRLMRLRLERLLCWRESPERWPIYQHMPPVLILARSTRQRDHWQRAAEAAALKLRLDPLAGAVVSLPSSDCARMNPWQLSWRTLSSDASCRLQQLLRPLPCTAFPPPLWSEVGEDEAEERVAQPSATVSMTSHIVSSERPARPRRLIRGNLAKRALHLTTQAEQGEQEVIALLGLRLSTCHWNILRLLLAHPLLSLHEVAAALDCQPNSVRSALSELYQLACIESLSTEVGKRWHLRERGLRLLAASSHLHIRNLAVMSVDEAGGEPSDLRQRGEAWLLSHMQHTAGIYTFFTDLAQAARQESERELLWWETGAACERRYQVGEHWHNLRPDALAAYRVGPHQFHFWLEWDRGTMNARDLAIKFASYAHYLASREWARERSMVPRFVCVAPDIAQERRMHRAAQASCVAHSGLGIWTTTEVLLKERGPLAPIWLQEVPRGSSPVQPGATLRQQWNEVMLGK